MKEFLSKLISIPSIKDTPTNNAPFGENIRKALDVFLAEAKNLGLRTHDENGYYGWAEYGEGESSIAIACHIDVVPATGNWNLPPYTLTEKDGLYYGRGVADDKGAIAVSLKLLKELKESNAKLSHRIRVIVGCDEESGSECMEKYNAIDELPTFAIVPDADFPIVNSEKGIQHITLCAKSGNIASEVIEIYGGERPNIVCDRAYAKLKKDGIIGSFINANGTKNVMNCSKISDTLSRFSVNPNEVFAVGFSAGGHLVANLSCEHMLIEEKYGKPLDCKPTAVGLSYPVIFYNGHQGSFINLTQGMPEAERDATIASLELDTRVTAETSPAFIWSTFEDQLVPCENSLRYAMALKKAGVRFALHVYPFGQHGLASSDMEISGGYGKDAVEYSRAWIDDCCKFFRIYVEEQY
jgi:dienelactone hydrolase